MMSPRRSRLDDTSESHGATPHNVAPQVSPDLDEYIAPIRAGDERAFEFVYRSLAKPLIEFGAGILGDIPAARDVVADIFVALWENRATWSPSRGVRAYLFTAVRHRAINVLRNRRRHDRAHAVMAAEPETPGLAVSTPSVDRSLDLAEQVDTVFRVIGRFPAARRTAMTLRWQGGLSVMEIAEAMGITQNAVKLHLSRGLTALRHLLSGQGQ